MNFLINIDEYLLWFSYIYSNMKLERASAFLLIMVVGASANEINRIANITTQSPTTKTVQAPDDKFVVDLTRDSFNQSVANGSHFVMFYDPT